MKYLYSRDYYWIAPLSFGLGAVLSSLQVGDWLFGWLGFSFLFLLCFSLLTVSTRWAGGEKTLIWMVSLAFALRFVGGVATYLALPVNGFEDADDKAGYVYTDAHRRDVQAWDLAKSEHPIVDAFNKNYAYDQYGGLLAFSAFVYRYISPDAHRPLMLVLLSAFVATLGLPFAWKAVTQEWGGEVAVAFGWIYVLYPESVLLGGSSMRESYLLLFSAFALWGFVSWHALNSMNRPNVFDRRSLVWLVFGIVGMLLVSPVVALVTLLIFAGWIYFTSGHGYPSWWGMTILAVVFIIGSFVLASSLDRGNLSGGTPLSVVNKFLREAARLNLNHLVAGSGWVKKLFDEMPEWMRIPFVLIYGLFQPVLPAAIVEPTTLTWRIIAILRAMGWYSLLPALILSFKMAASSSEVGRRNLLIWLSLNVWGWILLTSLRGGADQWDNPRYRTIMFLWQTILAGHLWVWWRESRNAWLIRVVSMEMVFLFFFGQWYANRYFHLGTQYPFGQIVVTILGLWALIFIFGIWRDRFQS
ncbi:MAG: hypothetical protein JNM55_19535 [Anaerolineales bacterium]|nr:hypothetical protein [Anaerolineales bacterium]